MSDFEKYWEENASKDSWANKAVAWNIWKEKQARLDELQRRNQMLNDNIKEQGQKLVYQNEVIETQAEKLLDLGDEKAELQKRVDSTLKVVQSMRNEVKHGHMSDEEVQMLSSFADELEQALKGGEA